MASEVIDMAIAGILWAVPAWLVGLTMALAYALSLLLFFKGERTYWRISITGIFFVVALLFIRIEFGWRRDGEGMALISICMLVLAFNSVTRNAKLLGVSRWIKQHLQRFRGLSAWLLPWFLWLRRR